MERTALDNNHISKLELLDPQSDAAGTESVSHPAARSPFPWPRTESI